MFGRRVVVTALVLCAGSIALAQPADKPQKQQEEKQAQKAKPFKLMIGDKAPELAIDTWVKGEPVTGFEKGKVYIVEFWATWCGPCIASMPHVTELQKEYKGKGLTVIGVNIWDEPKNVAPFMREGNERRKAGDELMGYTVAIEKKDNPDNVRNGVMSRTWMEAAGRDGIPCAFIVDQQGKVAYIGHPMKIDEPLKAVVSGTFDYEKAAAEHATAAAAAAITNKFHELYGAGNFDAAFALAREQVEKAWWTDSGQLNAVAWYIVDPEGKVEWKDLSLAYKAASRACELTKWEDGAILDTLARCYFLKGDVAKAIEVQQKAVAAEDGPMKAQLEGVLEEYKAAAARK